MNKLIVCVSSTIHGSGRTTFAKYLAEAAGYGFVSAGGIIREIAEEKGCSVDEVFKMGELDLNLMLDRRIKEIVSKGDWVVDSSVAPYYLKPDLDIVVHASIRKIGWRVYVYRRPGDPDFRSPWDAGLRMVKRTFEDVEMFGRLAEKAPQPWAKVYKKASKGILNKALFALGIGKKPKCDFLYVNNGSYLRAKERAERIAKKYLY